MFTNVFAILAALTFPNFVVGRATTQGRCFEDDPGMRWLRERLSPNAAISCRGEPLQLSNAERYWALQQAENASVVVFPATTQDVSYTIRATRKTRLGEGFAFVSGGHSTTGASSSRGLVLDLRLLNRTTVLHDFTISRGDEPLTVIAYEGGVDSYGLQKAVNGTGWTAISARASSVGMGGFSTGGGIGFLANAYGYAVDRLVAMEIVLSSGKTVFATKTNRYSDLFWAFQGGAGQFGVATKFYQRALPAPKSVRVGYHVVANVSASRSYRNTATFLKEHSDPFSLMYYALAYLPPSLSPQNATPSEYRTRRLMVTLW